MSRILGVDYGERRIGLALSDPFGIIAKPLKVIDQFECISKINYIKYSLPEKKDNLIIIDENNINELVVALKLKNL